MKKQLLSLSVTLSLLLVFFYTPAGAQAKKGNSKPTTTVSRSVSNNSDNSVATVTITINKQAFRGHASIEENFSSDLQATAISTEHGNFRCENGKATIDWDNIPEDKTITVSYSIRALRNTAEDQTVSGHLAYQNQTFDMPASSFKIKFTGKYSAPTASNNEAVDPNSTNTLQDLYYVVFGEYPGNSGGSSAPSYNEPAKVNMAATKASKPAAKHEAAPAPVQQKPVVAEAPKPAPTPVPTPAPTPVAAAPAPPTNPAVSTASSAPVVVPAATPTTSAVVYRVQIAAVPDKSKADGILKQYKINDQPYFEVVSPSVTRVMVGNYSNLNDAKARIAELKNNGLTGAYVAPYFKGKRVSLTEAASHTQQ